MVVHTQPTESGHIGGGRKYHVVTFIFQHSTFSDCPDRKGRTMDIETITKLLDAGYTKAEIDAMQNADNAGGASDENSGADNTQAGEIKGNGNAENAEQVNNPVDISVAVEALTNTVKGLQETVKAIQTANVAGASSTGVKDTSVDDAMKSFLKTL